MSDTNVDFITNSKSNLIEVHHVGVTAKLQSPLKKFLASGSSSTETESAQILFPSNTCKNKHSYDAFTNDSQIDTTMSTGTEDVSSRVLYEMRAMPCTLSRASKVTPSRIEFQRYSRTQQKHPRFTLPTVATSKKKRKTKTKSTTTTNKAQSTKHSTTGIFQRLRQSLDNMCQCKPECRNAKLIDDLPEPHWNASKSKSNCIGIYPFEHGCADYLSINDSHPRINAIVYAERATIYATHFWAEFFGIFHIGVAFIVAFVLQSYRFVLYSLINTLVAGLLHMTSDYLLKPTLTVIFNGFLQPPLIFIYNVLCSFRDILEPVADTLNNFMKPIATVGKSFRLVHVNYTQRRCLEKEV